MSLASSILLTLLFSTTFISLTLSQGCTWSYERNANNGPSHWADLCDGAWTSCSSEIIAQQSPINLISDTLHENNNGSLFSAKPYSALSIDYAQLQEMKLNKPDQVLFAEYTEGTFTVGDLDTLSTKTISFHTPSEHQLDGRTYEMEIQIEHRVPSDSDEDDEVVILSFLVNGNGGTKNEWLQELIDAGIPQLQGARSIETSPKFIVPEDRSYFWYEGTATTPPCSKAKWFVFRRPIEATPAQVNRFASSLQISNRPLQDFNNHQVFWFDRTHSTHAWILVLLIIVFMCVIFVGFAAGIAYRLIKAKVFPNQKFAAGDGLYSEEATLREDPAVYGSA